VLREFHSKIIDLELHTQRPAAEAPPSASAAAAKQEDLHVASSWCTVPKNSLDIAEVTGKVRAGRARAPLLLQSTARTTVGVREQGRRPKAQGLTDRQCVAHHTPHKCASTTKGDDQQSDLKSKTKSSKSHHFRRSRVISFPRNLGFQTHERSLHCLTRNSS